MKFCDVTLVFGDECHRCKELVIEQGRHNFTHLSWKKPAEDIWRASTVCHEQLAVLSARIEPEKLQKESIANLVKTHGAIYYQGGMS